MRYSLGSKCFSKQTYCLVFGAVILFIGAGAQAQFDKNWLEQALKSAQEAASPWPDAPLPDALLPDALSTDGLPAQSEASATERLSHPLSGTAAPLLSPPRLDVVPVDHFDDPWEPRPKLSVSTPELIDPWAEDLAPPASLEASVQNSTYESNDLVDPWGE